jgi:hypothetical protein
MIRTIGKAQTELNAKKGIWCEFCRTPCYNSNLITLRRATNVFTDDNWEVTTLMCTSCAQNIIKCIQRSLMDSLLIGEK